MRDVYGTMDVYVQAANSEGFGAPSIEAAACGIPVYTVPYAAQQDIATKIISKPIPYSRLEREIETNCYRALIDVDGFREVLKDKFNISKQEVRKKYEKNYSWERTKDKWANLVNSIPPKNMWGAPPDIQSPIPFDQLARLNNSEFVKHCIMRVAHKPDLLGSYMHAETLDALNCGFIIPYNKHIGEYSAKVIKFDKQSVYNHYLAIRLKINECEKHRAQQNQNSLQR